MTDISNLRKRLADEKSMLAKMESDEARNRVEVRIVRLNALIAEYNSLYGVPRPCYCIR